MTGLDFVGEAKIIEKEPDEMFRPEVKYFGDVCANVEEHLVAYRLVLFIVQRIPKSCLWEKWTSNIRKEDEKQFDYPSKE